MVYLTTLKTEEAESLTCTVAYVDPTCPEPEPPRRHVADHWRCTSLGEPVPCDPRNLAKLSKGADPTTTILAVHADTSGELFIWGLIDQVAVHALRFLTWETDHGPSTPGNFYVTATGVADLTVGLDYEILGALKQDAIIEKFDNVFGGGPVLRLLGASFGDSLTAIRESYPDVDSHDVQRWVTVDRIAVISRILLQIQSYKHGGALLITPESADDLNLKYRLTYDRLPEALVRRTLTGMRLEDARHAIYDHALPDADSISPAMFREYAQAENNWREGLSELAGCVRFIASLSKIDGLIMMRPDLKLLGFGVEILGANEIDKVFIATDESATRLREIKANHFGTRHRSMMRYCSSHPGALGFVVSQDGFVRAITRVGSKVVMWENIRVRNEFESDTSKQEVCPHCENFAEQVN